MDRAAFLDRVLAKYAGCYDIVRGEAGDILAAKCEYHEHGVGYALVRKAEMWSADKHEYVWFYSVPKLTADLYDKCYSEAFSAGMEKVKPEQGHMCSIISVVFVCDSAEPEAVEKVRRCKFRKDFKFGLNGWAVVHCSLVEVEPETVTVNGEGRNEARFFKSVLHPVRKERFFTKVKRWVKGLFVRNA